MFAKPTGRRKLTLSEWVNLLSATGTMLSAIFALLAVLAANRQVTTALDAVNRAEKLKALSEYGAFARDACGTIIPPKLSKMLTLHTPPENYSLPPPGEMYYFDQIAKYNDDELRDMLFRNATLRLEKFDSLVVKGKAVAVWLNDEQRKDFDKFNYYLHQESRREATADGKSILSIISGTFGICQNRIDSKIAELAR
ncbi:hypothetical protein MKK50_16195 [Methylobacterium sp. J-043]|nr:hypothetical protein [Methylobacterium sp. J-043]